MLKRSLGPLHLWSLAVGLVIGGEYFGWSYGWSVSGPIGFLVATLLVAALYTTFVFSFTELTTSVPDAGGPFAYATRAFGPNMGFVAGFATSVEFLFAPPAIAFALGSYLHVLSPAISEQNAALAVLATFSALNLLGVHHSARFELVVTVLAVLELLAFIGVVGPHFQTSHFLNDPWAGGVSGIFAAIPYAIWFFLAIEGVAMAAEEVKNPKRDIPLGYITGILTLLILAFGVMFAAGGAGDWRKLSQMDYPIPEAVSMALGSGHPLTKAFAGIGLFGLVASLNGIILGASRQVYALARVGLLPPSLTQLNRHQVPYRSVFLTAAIGVVSILSGRTSELITLSALGAVLMYMISMASLFSLRKQEPQLERPFRAPFYPAFPAIALVLSFVCLVAICYFNMRSAIAFLVLLSASLSYQMIRNKKKIPNLIDLNDEIESANLL